MKNSILTAVLTFALCTVLAQTEKPSYKSVADKFEQYYNQENNDSIFSLFSSEMQKALPIDKTNGFLSQLRTQVGKITQREFARYEATYGTYKTTFERGVFAVNISVDNNDKINGLFVKPFVPDSLPEIERNTTKLVAPFKGAWTIYWGGDTRAQNYHVESQAQKNAFDIMIFKDGKTYKTDGKTNEDYYAFGQELLAPCDGEVVLVVDGVKDNTPGILNPVYIPGNSVIIKTINKEYLFFAHFKQHSVKVKQGQMVKRGEVLGLCGNSGNSSEPHLHFHIQNVEDMNIATGVKCYFDKLIVNGQLKNDCSPVKGETIKNE
jgi:murein DD-endopeptidase MepM/ murein hydrolase activator NlpD